MTDFPALTIDLPTGGCVTQSHPQAGSWGSALMGVVNPTAASWPQASRVICIPFTVTNTVKAQQMFWELGVISGTTDVGLLDSNLSRLVNLGATTNASTASVGNITDTTLTPGLYYMGIVANNGTQTYNSMVSVSQWCRACGMVQQLTSGNTIPSTVTAGTISSGFVPVVGVSFTSVV